MNLARGLAQREAEGRPIRVGLIGAGKFGTMILAQLRLMRGVRLAVLADLDGARARAAAAEAGWDLAAFVHASSIGAANDAARAEKTALVESGEVAAACQIDVLIEATGHEAAGALHAYRALERGVHVVMVTVEADVVVGPYLHHVAQRSGAVYSMAYGDQPAIICELVDWARTCGFDVVAAGKGTKYAPHYRRSTPDTAFGYYGFTPEQIATGGFNPRMFNSFLDGTKSAIEMVAVANATGLGVASDGLSFAPASVYELPTLLRPRADGGILPHAGMVDVVSCVREDETFVPDHLRWGVYVTFTSASDYAKRCFGEYGITTDPSGRYAALWRPYHLIGLEIGVSIASAALHGEPTGAPFAGHRAEVVCATRGAMSRDETIDGEGGYAVYGTCVPAELARERRLIPMGLAHGLRLLRDVPPDHPIGEDDVAFDESSFLWKLRREQDALFAPVTA
ncbi:MAG TPA: flagellar biosynthesis protein FlgA [Candidatus Limnocylindria bacterium]|jgi:predicted homoserine dehydrogenase-like protein|nr:flagellar biosynthesis protein FlgA [Candidatus Limnocylindria bacterium]